MEDNEKICAESGKIGAESGMLNPREETLTELAESLRCRFTLQAAKAAAVKNSCRRRGYSFRFWRITAVCTDFARFCTDFSVDTRCLRYYNIIWIMIVTRFMKGQEAGSRGKQAGNPEQELILPSEEAAV